MIIKLAGTDDLLRLIAWAHLIGVLPLLALSYVFEGGPAAFTALVAISWVTIGELFFLGLIATCFGFVLWSYLLRRYPAYLVTPFSLIIPISGLISTALLLDESLGRNGSRAWGWSSSASFWQCSASASAAPCAFSPDFSPMPRSARRLARAGDGGAVQVLSVPFMPRSHTMLARTLAATGLALALALTAAKPGQAEVVCDTESAEDGACDPGTAAKTVADGAEAPAVSADDLPVDAIRQIIREYLIEHPEVLIEAQQALQAKRAAREAEQAKEAIQRYRDEIFFDPEAPGRR